MGLYYFEGGILQEAKIGDKFIAKKHSCARELSLLDCCHEEASWVEVATSMLSGTGF